MDENRLNKKGFLILKLSVKQRIAKVTGSHMEIDKKFMDMKKSWDEVDKLLESTSKKNKKR